MLDKRDVRRAGKHGQLGIREAGDVPPAHRRRGDGSSTECSGRTMSESPSTSSVRAFMARISLSGTVGRC